MNNVYEVALNGQLDSISFGNLNILLDVAVTHQLVVPGSFDPKAASDLEYYGYSEMDFLITGGEYWDGSQDAENFSVWVRLTDEQLTELDDKYSSEIQDILWDLSDKAKLDDVELNHYPAA